MDDLLGPPSTGQQYGQQQYVPGSEYYTPPPAPDPGAGDEGLNVFAQGHSWAAFATVLALGPLRCKRLVLLKKRRIQAALLSLLPGYPNFQAGTMQPDRSPKAQRKPFDASSRPILDPWLPLAALAEELAETPEPEVSPPITSATEALGTENHSFYGISWMSS
ncbi:unnamed protein product [Cladocopium goreaui]|uniref:Ultraviolet-B receptor UVR8 n=1 Tax=Cladocopium goreaui TaxID=2562237 RepID=A0A9P1DEQ0_9DINO|nr:unnamed protein product [Cladocopium goreaui]